MRRLRPSVSKSTSTHHFRVLREAGVIAQVEQGNRKLNTLRRDELEQQLPGPAGGRARRLVTLRAAGRRALLECRYAM